MKRQPPKSTRTYSLLPYTTLCRSEVSCEGVHQEGRPLRQAARVEGPGGEAEAEGAAAGPVLRQAIGCFACETGRAQGAAARRAAAPPARPPRREIGRAHV